MQIEYLPAARADIRCTVDYLVSSLAAPQAAESLLDELDAAVQSLLQFPYSAPLYRSERPLPSEVRFVAVKNYVLYYVVIGDKIQIRRFLHARQNRGRMEL